MTPFGEKLRSLRAERGITQAQMAEALQVSGSYLSALEHGRRGRPTWDLLQRIIGYLQVIWDDAEELERLARLSDPRVVVDTAKLPAKCTLVANELADRIAFLDDEALDGILKLVADGSNSESRKKLSRKERLIRNRRRKLAAAESGQTLSKRQDA
ncbi:MAG: helix-turn-helix transcriptional regulator [Pseudomonadota bacterium]